MRARRYIKWRRDRWRVLYVEGEGLTRPLFIALLQSLEVPASATFTREGPNWLLAEFPSFGRPQLSRLVEALPRTAPAEMRLKVLRFNAFRRYKRQLRSIFRQPKIHN